MQKIENYKSALSQLETAIETYTSTPADALYRDGLIQRFEFTVEFAWKSIKEYLEDQGMALSIASPRGILKEAFSVGVIADADVWNRVLTARNQTSHIYDETTADRIAQEICTDFLSPLKALAEFYSNS